MVNIMKYLLVNNENGGIYGWYKSKDEAEKQRETMTNKDDWHVE